MNACLANGSFAPRRGSHPPVETFTPTLHIKQFVQTTGLRVIRRGSTPQEIAADHSVFRPQSSHLFHGCDEVRVTPIESVGYRVKKVGAKHLRHVDTAISSETRRSKDIGLAVSVGITGESLHIADICLPIPTMAGPFRGRVAQSGIIKSIGIEKDRSVAQRRRKTVEALFREYSPEGSDHRNRHTAQLP